MKKYLLAILILFGLPITLFYILCEIEITESHFQTYEDVGKYIDAGWLPEWLPKTSYDIYESHDIDSNFVWSVFKINQIENFDNLPCTKIDSKNIQLPSIKYIKRFPKFVLDSYERIQNNRDMFIYVCDEYFLAGENNIINLWTANQ